MPLTCRDHNLSSDSVTEDLWTVPEELKSNGLVTGLFSILITLIGTPANLIIITGVIRNKLYNQPFFILVFNLAVADLVSCVLLPIHIASEIAGSFPFGNTDVIRCRVCHIAIIPIIFVFMSLLTATLMSIDRFIFFKYPLRYEVIITWKKAAVAVFIIWLVSVFISIMPTYNFGSIYFNESIVNCGVNFSDRYYIVLLFSVALLCLLVILFANVWIFCIVQAQLRKIYGVYYSHTSEMEKEDFYKELSAKYKKKAVKREVYIMRYFILYFVSDVLTWIPITFVAILSIASVVLPPSYVGCSYVFVRAQALFHPLVALTIDSDLRPRFFSKCCRKQPNNGVKGHVGVMDKVKCCTCCSILSVAMVPEEVANRHLSAVPRAREKGQEKEEAV